MRGRVHARRTLKGLVADLRIYYIYSHPQLSYGEITPFDGTLDMCNTRSLNVIVFFASLFSLKTTMNPFGLTDNFAKIDR